MTIKEIEAVLDDAGKPVSRAMIYVYFNRIGISPAGANQRPQQYPEDTADRIKAHLGLVTANQKPNGIASMPDLRRERRKSQKVKR